MLTKKVCCLESTSPVTCSEFELKTVKQYSTFLKYKISSGTYVMWYRLGIFWTPFLPFTIVQYSLFWGYVLLQQLIRGQPAQNFKWPPVILPYAGFSLCRLCFLFVVFVMYACHERYFHCCMMSHIYFLFLLCPFSLERMCSTCCT